MNIICCSIVLIPIKRDLTNFFFFSNARFCQAWRLLSLLCKGAGSWCPLPYFYIPGLSDGKMGNAEPIRCLDVKSHAPVPKYFDVRAAQIQAEIVVQKKEGKHGRLPPSLPRT